MKKNNNQTLKKKLKLYSLKQLESFFQKATQPQVKKRWTAKIKDFTIDQQVYAQKVANTKERSKIFRSAYNYAQKEWFKEKILPTVEWTYGKRNPRAIEEYVNLNYTRWKPTRQADRELVKKIQFKVFNEELGQRKQELLAKQQEIGLTKTNPRYIKKQALAYSFTPEANEQEEFIQKDKATKNQLENYWKLPVKLRKAYVTKETNLAHSKSPERMRDWKLVNTNQTLPLNAYEIIYQQYLNNKKLADQQFKPSKINYVQALNWFSQQQKEIVPESEIEYNQRGSPKLKSGWWLSPNSNTDLKTKKWTVYREIKSDNREEQITNILNKVSEITYQAENEQIYETFKKVKNLGWDGGICLVEHFRKETCEEIAKNSPGGGWCLDCLMWGNAYHPPSLPKNCSWLYTFKPTTCGTAEHPEANKQWHWSLEGFMNETVRIKGGDWLGCHLGRYDFKKDKKSRRKSYEK